MITKHKGSTMTTVLVFIGVMVALLVLLKLTKKNSFANKTNREVALTCTTDMATQFHVHPHLEIVINGQKQEIPVNIGVGSTCMNALHTHSNDGTIHVESPEKRDFTLADFFAIWKKPFSREQILDYKTDDTHVIKLTVNGQEVFDYENTVMRDKNKISIEYKKK